MTAISPTPKSFWPKKQVGSNPSPATINIANIHIEKKCKTEKN